MSQNFGKANKTWAGAIRDVVWVSEGHSRVLLTDVRARITVGLDKMAVINQKENYRQEHCLVRSYL